MKILVADDNAVTATLMTGILTRHGYTVVLARNGSEALGMQCVPRVKGRFHARSEAPPFRTRNEKSGLVMLDPREVLARIIAGDGRIGKRPATAGGHEKAADLQNRSALRLLQGAEGADVTAPPHRPPRDR